MTEFSEKYLRQGEAAQQACGIIERFISDADRNDLVLLRLQDRLEGMVNYLNTRAIGKKGLIMQTRFKGRKLEAKDLSGQGL